MNTPHKNTFICSLLSVNFALFAPLIENQKKSRVLYKYYMKADTFLKKAVSEGKITLQPNKIKEEFGTLENARDAFSQAWANSKKIHNIVDKERTRGNMLSVNKRAINSYVNLALLIIDLLKN
jgi:hypothetical protein